MKSFQTAAETPVLKPSRKPAPTLTMDELCDEPGCDHMFRKHIFGNLCGEMLCPCTKFKPSVRQYEWTPKK